jgi:hypothetical protein
MMRLAGPLGFFSRVLVSPSVFLSILGGHDFDPSTNAWCLAYGAWCSFLAVLGSSVGLLCMPLEHVTRSLFSSLCGFLFSGFSPCSLALLLMYIATGMLRL